MLRSCALFLLACALAACSGDRHEDGRSASAQKFPKAYRPVSKQGLTAFSNEEDRDNRQEATIVMDLAELSEGMTVADIGAGEGYYTVRLAERVGVDGRVLAEDIDAEVRDRLAQRVLRDQLDNVSVQLGKSDDPRLPANSFDRIFLVHMYHEVEEPFAFLWHLRPALRSGGQVIVVDVDRPSDRHGISPQVLFCEFASVGFKLVKFIRHPALVGYYAQFEAVGERPQPEEIESCGRPGEDKETAPA